MEELADDARRELREERERLRAEVRRVRERIEEVLGELEQAVPRAERTSPEVEGRGRTEGATNDAFLTDVIESVDRYWVRTFAANRLEEPQVRYAWVPPGQVLATACEAAADDNAAFYCPADDTIYLAQRLAAQFYRAVGVRGDRRRQRRLLLPGG